MKKLVIFIYVSCIVQVGFSQNAIESVTFSENSKTYSFSSFGDFTDKFYEQITILSVDAHNTNYNVEVNKTNSHPEIAGVKFRIKSLYTNSGSNNDPNRGLESILGDVTEVYQNIYVPSRKPSGQNYIGTHTISLELGGLTSSIPPGTYTVQLNFNVYGVDRDQSLSKSFLVYFQVGEIVEITVEKFSLKPFIFNSFDLLTNGLHEDIFKVNLKSNKENVSRLLNIYVINEDGISNNLENSIFGIRKKGSSSYLPLTSVSRSIPVESVQYSTEHIFELEVKPDFIWDPGNYTSQIFYTFTEP